MSQTTGNAVQRRVLELAMIEANERVTANAELHGVLMSHTAHAAVAGLEKLDFLLREQALRALVELMGGSVPVRVINR